ncbi:hypothetical protein ONZ45_g11415 [Pleurotus djamor]|nr:hypothetical protein ONZ45_g11415 [Pleurotus djamor]
MSGTGTSTEAIVASFWGQSSRPGSIGSSPPPSPLSALSSPQFAEGSDLGAPYLSAPQSRPHRKKTAQPHVPRPPNAFILFRSHFIRSQHVSSKVETNHSTLSKIIGMTWKGMSDAEKAVWYERAKRAVEEHKKKWPKYTFRPVYAQKKGRNEEDGGISTGRECKGGRRGERKRVREVEPTDEVRCKTIADLLSQGLRGKALDDAIKDFDKHHVPQVVTRFEVPLTAKEYDTTRRLASGSPPQTSSPLTVADSVTSAPQPALPPSPTWTSPPTTPLEPQSSEQVSMSHGNPYPFRDPLLPKPESPLPMQALGPSPPMTMHANQSYPYNPTIPKQSQSSTFDASPQYTMTPASVNAYEGLAMPIPRHDIPAFLDAAFSSPTSPFTSEFVDPTSPSYVTTFNHSYNPVPESELVPSDAPLSPLSPSTSCGDIYDVYGDNAFSSSSFGSPVDEYTHIPQMVSAGLALRLLEVISVKHGRIMREAPHQQQRRDPSVNSDCQVSLSDAMIVVSQETRVTRLPVDKKPKKAGKKGKAAAAPPPPADDAAPPADDAAPADA